MVVMKLEVKESSENLSSKQLLPTPAMFQSYVRGSANNKMRTADQRTVHV